MSSPRIGLATAQMRYSIEDIAWMWEEASDAFDSLWLSDHYTAPAIHPNRPPFESWTALCHLAQRAPRCEVGVLVSAVTLRPPIPDALIRVSDTAFGASGWRLSIGVGA